MEPVALRVRQARDKGVLARQVLNDRIGFRIFGDKARHLGGKFVCQPHDCQKFLPPGRQRVDHCRGEHFENIRACVWEPAALGKRAQVQIDCREPALARPKKRLQLLLGKLCAAAVGIDGKLGVVEPQVLHADLVQISAQADNLARGQEPVAAGNDQVRILGQARADAADEAHGALVAQQMKIVEEQIIRRLAGGKRAAKLLQNQRCGSLAGRKIEGAEHIQPREPERILRAAPEHGQLFRVNAQPDGNGFAALRLFGKKPVDSGRLAVAHGGDHSRQRAARNRAQALLHALGDVDGVEARLSFGHTILFLPRFSAGDSYFFILYHSFFALSPPRKTPRFCLRDSFAAARRCSARGGTRRAQVRASCKPARRTWGQALHSARARKARADTAGGASRRCR